MASAATVAPSATASQKSSASANPTALDRASARYRAAQSRYRQAKAALKAIKRQIVPVDAFGNRKPRLRGWLHLATLPLCIAASIVLICIAPAGSVKAACAVYGASAMLLFGKNPKHFFPRARIRFVRYEGTEARVGARMNVIKDVMFEGRILQVTEKALEFGEMLKRRTGLEVVMWDERLTTVEADRTLMEAGVRRENRKQYLDGLAAVFILQGYLDSLVMK